MFPLQLLAAFGPFSSKNKMMEMMLMYHRYLSCYYEDVIGTKAAISTVFIILCHLRIRKGFFITRYLLSGSFFDKIPSSSSAKFRAKIRFFHFEIDFLMPLSASSRIVQSRTTAVLSASAALPLQLRSYLPSAYSDHARSLTSCDSRQQ